jgi:hypothetical protein
MNLSRVLFLLRNIFLSLISPLAILYFIYMVFVRNDHLFDLSFLLALLFVFLIKLLFRPQNNPEHRQ